MNRHLPILLALLLVAPAVAVAQETDLPRLIEALSKDEKVANRKKAAGQLGQLGVRAEKAVPALVKALEDVDVAVRDEAEAALVKIGEVAVPGLLDGLKNEDQFVRVRVVGILGNIGPPAKKALDALETAQVKDDSTFVKEAAEKAVFRVKVDCKTLIGMLKDKDEAQRLYAVKGVAVLGGQLGKAGIPPVGQTLLNDKSKDVRREAAKTLGSVGKEGLVALADLAKALNDKDPEVRLQAVVSIGEFGTDARNAAQHVQAALNRHGKTNETFRDAAETTLRRLTSRK
jgi:HEAT repeat protein